MRQRLRMRLIFLAAAGSLASACVGHLPPMPPELETPGVKTPGAPFVRTAVTSFVDGPLASRVMYIGRDAARDLLVATELGLRRIPAGGPPRDVTFATRAFEASPVGLPNGALGFAGLSGSSEVVVLDLDGRVVSTIRGERYKRPVVGNVAGSPDAEIMLPGADGMQIVTLSGTRVARLKSPWYASDHVTVQADDDPALEIGFVRTHLDRPSIDVSIVNADGSAVADWADSDGTWLSSVPALGDGILWGLTRQGFGAWTARGQRQAEYPAEASHYLRYVRGARSGEFVALVASGDGYRNASMLCIYDRDRKLVFEEVFDTRAYAVFGDAGATAFYLGVGQQVYRYEPQASRRDKQ